jgi:uncharacterized protein
VATRVPERTCVGCRTRSLKTDLVRMVRTTDGAIRVDAAAPGRGAYVHRSADCLEMALRRRAIDRALRTSVGSEEARKLRGIVGRMQGNG